MVRLPYGGSASPRVSGASGMMKSPITKTTAVKATGKPSVCRVQHCSAKQEIDARADEPAERRAECECRCAHTCLELLG